MVKSFLKLVDKKLEPIRKTLLGDLKQHGATLYGACFDDKRSKFRR